MTANHGFGKKVRTNERSTVASEMDDPELYLIRDFCKFSNVAEKAAKSSNRYSKAKSIRDEMALYKLTNVKKINNN